ncbi:MAG: ATP-dependent DNA ligase [Pyrinomonadaceae bacterium]
MELLQVATRIEARYIVRITLGRLRLGVGAPTIIEAVARTTDQAKEARRIIERAYNTCSDLGLVLKQMVEKGLPELQEFKVSVGRPVRPMLAERLPGAAEVIKKIGTCAVEAKLDGFRCQVHLQSDSVDMFSRNLEKTTGMFPELADAARHDFDAETAIIDGEALAINEETGEFYPFQVTVQRKRKHQVERMAEEFPLVLVAFDLLYVNGRDLTNLSYLERRAELASRLKTGGRIRLSEGEVVNTTEELQAFFDRGLENGHEGVVAKRVSSAYEPGARNFNWIKLKRAYKGELNDTVDLVLIGYLHGRGARAKLGIGSLLGAVYDQPTDTFKSVAKIGSGLSKENWVKIKTLLDTSIVDHKPPRVDSKLVPDVWVEPQIVVTVLADELTRSPIHTAAQDADGRGLALRFPRVVNFVREDKSPEDATTAKEIEDIYNQQKRSQSKT